MHENRVVLSADEHGNKIREYFQSRFPASNARRCFDATALRQRNAYFICFTNRSGSNYLAQALASDGKLEQALESINFDAVVKCSEQFGYTSFVEYFSGLVGRSDKEYFGCKVGAGQLQYLYNEGLLDKFGSTPKFIHIRRRDVLSQAVSKYIAKKTGKWSSEHAGNDVKIAFDSNQILAILKWTCLCNGIFDSLFQLFGVKPITVYYEDFVEAPDETVSRIGDYLGVINLGYVSSEIKCKKQSNEMNEDLLVRLKKEFMICAGEE